MSISQTISQRSVLDRRPSGVVGQVSSDPKTRVRAALNSDPQAPQISTLTVANYADGKTYSWTINSVADSYLTISGDTDTTGAAAKIAAKINSNPNYRGQVRATSSGAVVTITSTYPGLSFTLVGGTDLAAAPVQVAARAANLPIGRGVLVGAQVNYDYESYSERGANLTLKRALAGNLTARVIHVTPTAANSTQFGLAILLPTGEVYSFAVVSDGSGAVQEIVEAQVAAFPAALANIVTATEDDTKLILTAAPGQQFNVIPYGAGVQAVAVATEGDDIAKKFLGFSCYTTGMQVPIIEGNELYYEAERAASILVEGPILVECSEAIAYGDPVYISLASDDAGKAYKVAAANRVRIPNAKWIMRGASSDNLAWLEVA
jgi:hypothetical protein